MAGMLAIAQDYAQSRSGLAAIVLIFTLPGFYIIVTGGSFSETITEHYREIGPTTSKMTCDLALYNIRKSATEAILSASTWGNTLPTKGIADQARQAQRHAHWMLRTIEKWLGFSFDSPLPYLGVRWPRWIPYHGLITVVSMTLAVNILSILVNRRPILTVLHDQIHSVKSIGFLVVVTYAKRHISTPSILVTAFIIIIIHLYLREIVDAVIEGGITRLGSCRILSTLPDLAARLKLVATRKTIDRRTSLVTEQDIMVSISPHVKDQESHRLQHMLVDLRTTIKAKEIDLKRMQDDLSSARQTLNQSFIEYSSLRDEMKTIKQTIGRDHQAVIYRKDVELFALRKAIEQKESYIKDRDAKVGTAQQQHKAVLDRKDSRIRALEERIAILEARGQNIDKENISIHNGDQQAAVSVKLLRIKGRVLREGSCPNAEKEEITTGPEERPGPFRQGSTLARLQNELRRAWDVTHQLQTNLTNERDQHSKTRDKLQETAFRLEDELKNSSRRYSSTQLPTIEESDKHELEAMFNTAQQDNLRLYSEHESLDKRLREANARVFSCEQEVKSLRSRLTLEKAINDDMKNAIPSVVHRVYFQRMEGQLKESRDALSIKDEKIADLQMQVQARENELQEHQKLEEASHHNQVEEEYQLGQLTQETGLVDHKPTACFSPPQRSFSCSADRTSARFSGATLITDPGVTPVMGSDITSVNRPSTNSDRSIQLTPARMRRSTFESPRNNSNSNVDNIGEPFTMISDDIPPPAMRNAQSRQKTIEVESSFAENCR